LDGEAIVRALEDAERNPVQRPVDPKRLTRRPPALASKSGLVTVPSDKTRLRAQETGKETSPRTEAQWNLLQLGNGMGFRVWIARIDQCLEFEGQRFGDVSCEQSELPLEFDEATNQAIQLTDVLWLQGDSIAAAFEVKDMDSVSAGLLRMSDLIAMQPNLDIPLFIVAPDEGRDEVITEVNRPTFSGLSVPLHEMCRFISFASLNQAMEQITSMGRGPQPDVLDEISESCELE
jgi:hypothetical protein